MQDEERLASPHFCLCHQFERSLLQQVVAASRTSRPPLSLPFGGEASRAYSKPCLFNEQRQMGDETT